MNIEVTKQLIESFGFIVSPLLSIAMVYYFVKKILICKNNVDREITLLEDAQYYRRLIDKYRSILEESENKNYYNTFRRDVECELGYASSQYTTPAQITSRLKYLQKIKDDIDENITQIKT